MELMQDNCCLVILSCDTYKPVANLAAKQLSFFDASSYFPCYISLGVESMQDIRGFSVVNVGIGRTWSYDLKQLLSATDHEYFLIWIDDLIPVSKPDWNHIKCLISWLTDVKGNYLRLNPTPAGKGGMRTKGLNEIKPGEPYRASTVLAVWKKDVLLSILEESENAWQFEVYGSRRSDKYNGFYASDVFLVNYINLVIKGVVDPRAEKKLKALGFDLEGIPFPKMSLLKVSWLALREKISIVVQMLPSSIQNWVRSFIY
jgi:hypothetical protein